MKNLLATFLLLFPGVVFANNLQIPYVPNASGSDSIRSGTDQCTNTIDSPVKMDFGVVHSLEDNDLMDQKSSNNSVYARVVIPFSLFSGPAPNRIDCSRLYEIQLRERALDLRERELKVKALEDLEFKK